MHGIGQSVKSSERPSVCSSVHPMFEALYLHNCAI